MKMLMQMLITDVKLKAHPLISNVFSSHANRLNRPQLAARHLASNRHHSSLAMFKGRALLMSLSKPPM